MVGKPTYEELEIRVKLGEEEINKLNRKLEQLETEHKPLNFYTQAQNITERKQVEDALKKSEEKYRLLVNNLPGVVYRGYRDWSVEFYDNRIELLTGYHRDTFSSRNQKWLDLIVTDDIEPAKQNFIQALKTDKSYVRDYRIKTKTGDIIWIQERAYIVCNKNGDIEFVSGVFYDITEHKRAEGALRESEEKYRLLIENANDAIFIIKDGMVKFPNANTEDVTGFSEEELSKIPFENLIHPEDRDMVIERRRKRLRGEKPPSTYAFRIIDKSGKTLWVQLNTTLITWEGMPATINFIRDITEQKRLEYQIQQTQRIESLGTLAGGIAHDFNNILVPILMNTEIALLDIPEEHPARSNLNRVAEAAKRAKDLVRQILTISRKSEKTSVPFKISMILKEALRLLRAFVPSTIEIQFNIMTESDFLFGDPTQIHQVFMNLGTNAAQSMCENGGVMTLTLVDENIDTEAKAQIHNLSPGSYLKLSVSDTGHGIESRFMEKIFDPYFTTKKKNEGAGLGLAVVRGIILSHGGTVTVKSEVGKGTVFNIFLPKIERALLPENQEKDQLPTGSERILLVDDEKVVTEVNQSILKRLGYQVTGKTSATDALKTFKAEPDSFDLLITDMTMPRMTGVVLAREFRQIRRDIPIILCTGHSHLIDKDKAKQEGIQSFLMKPFAIFDIARTIRRVLDNTIEE